MTIDHTHDPQASSWVPGADEHADFPVQNLPLGVFANGDGQRRIGTAIGDYVLDLTALAGAGILPAEVSPNLQSGSLNALFALPANARLDLRHALFDCLASDRLRDQVEPHLSRASECTMQLPFRIGDYTDFYVGIHHATNIGKLLRPDNPLLPNYKYLPIAYHGRASSVRVSDTPVVRPRGQIKPPDAAAPVYEACRRLDYELELGVWIAGENAPGETVPVAEAWDRIGGLCLLNDWSARDVQVWEYQPLGPFLAKSFLTTVSPWVITSEALAPFRMALPLRPQGDPEPLDYLADGGESAMAIEVEAHIASAAMRAAGIAPHRLSRGSAAAAMYWSLAQMVAHHTSNGCNLSPGDLFGTGTLSGPAPGSEGSLMEISRSGQAPITLPTGETRAFLADGDELTLSARASREGYRTIGFGRCAGTVLPAR